MTDRVTTAQRIASDWLKSLRTVQDILANHKANKCKVNAVPDYLHLISHVSVSLPILIFFHYCLTYNSYDVCSGNLSYYQLIISLLILFLIFITSLPNIVVIGH